jgi:lipoprotein-anchoring transpeptidase ErfK/SrfK
MRLPATALAFALLLPVLAAQEPAVAPAPAPAPEPEVNAGSVPVIGANNQTEASAIPAAIPVDKTLRVFRQAPPVVSSGAVEGLDPKRLRIVVSLEKQTATLYSGDTVVIQTPVSTGRRNRATPRGSYKISRLEAELADKHFGNFVDPQDRVVRSAVDARYDYAPAGSRFQSAPKLHYLEFDPLEKRGFVAGDPPGYRSTSGDIILPRRIAALFFSAVQVGTPVEIQA